ncbi:D-2-hydroxyacid dehydrogenase [Variovorax sp. J2P1-59]|uniref:D-2-hydroxyacid dehydrogenase n=1 Tax=Variovorax flavidus TaxID=3053501 RepID=UPI002577F5AF|nr:D-2-hydroxyacid dehydrogenase [Variovorax sp. J2P1-59]MDM0073848.1 D-2-hydroxyacid dehydrogenase [Variovorax sp. J2P1-59]
MSGNSAMAPLRILLSDAARERVGAAIASAMGPRAHSFVAPQAGVDADLAFVTRDVTGLSTKHSVLPATQAFYDAMLGAPSLRWVHVHSAGADRPVYVELRARGVAISTSSGANAAVVAQTALAGLLALARRFPQLMRAQRERAWAPLIGTGLPRDLAGQTAVIVGWGPIGQHIAASLRLLGLRVVVVRSSAEPAAADIETLPFEEIGRVLPRADWLLLACPLTSRTRGLIDARAIALLPEGAHLVNVARGELVDEPALIEALSSGKLGGAFLDVFAHEPLPPESPLWGLDNVIATPHSAGFSDGNAARVTELFIDNLRRWLAGGKLQNEVA